MEGFKCHGNILLLYKRIKASLGSMKEGEWGDRIDSLLEILLK